MLNDKMINRIKIIIKRVENKGYNINSIKYQINCFNDIIMCIPHKFSKGNIIMTIFKDGNSCGGAMGKDFKNIEITL